MQKVVVQFDFPGVSQQQYDNAWEDLRAIGHDHPKGLIFHVGAPRPGGGWFICDVWESEEDFIKFGEVLIPIISKHDFPAIQPTFMPARFIYEGALTNTTV